MKATILPHRHSVVILSFLGLVLLLISCSNEDLYKNPPELIITLYVDTDRIEPDPDSVEKYVSFEKDKKTKYPKEYEVTAEPGTRVEWKGQPMYPEQVNRGDYVEITLIGMTGGKKVLRGDADLRPPAGSRVVRGKVRTNIFLNDRTEHYKIEFKVYRNDALKGTYTLDPKIRMLRP